MPATKRIGHETPKATRALHLCEQFRREWSRSWVVRNGGGERNLRPNSREVGREAVCLQSSGRAVSVPGPLRQRPRDQNATIPNCVNTCTENGHAAGSHESGGGGGQICDPVAGHWVGERGVCNLRVALFDPRAPSTATPGPKRNDSATQFPGTRSQTSSPPPPDMRDPTV